MRKILVFVNLLTILAFHAEISRAASATWLASPLTNEWSNAANWTAGGPPNSSSDIASFATSDQTNIVLNELAEVGGIRFAPGASAFTITVHTSGFIPAFRINGGIENNSGIVQNFVPEPTASGFSLSGLIFIMDGAAGSNTLFSNLGGVCSGCQGGGTEFYGQASAGHGNFSIDGGRVAANAFGGFVLLFDSSSAGDGTFTINAATVNFGHGGAINFIGNSTGGNGTFFIKAGELPNLDRGSIQFVDHSTAGEGDYHVEGPTSQSSEGQAGVIFFRYNSSAGNGTFNVQGSPNLPFDGGIVFLENSTAGNGTFFPVGGGVFHNNAGGIVFYNSSNAGSASFAVSNAAALGGFGTRVEFFDSSNANNAAFTINQKVNPNEDGAARGRSPRIAVATPGVAQDATFETDGGAIYFWSGSSAGSASVLAYGGAVANADGGAIYFADSSTASTGQFTLEGATIVDAGNARAEFLDHSNAGHSTFVVNGGQADGTVGGLLQFLESSNADHATLIANTGATVAAGAGKIIFAQQSSGGTARMEVFGKAELDLTLHVAGSVSLGSIEGDGDILLGGCSLAVGSNDRTTTFSGRIREADLGHGIHDSLTKVGAGELSLNNVNTYSGGTPISGGSLKALHDGALGSGNVSLAEGATLILQNGADTKYIGDSATFTIASGATVQLNYSGAPEVIGFLVINGVQEPPGLYGSAASGAPNQLSQLTGTGTLLVVNPQAFSRKIQGAAVFDLTLPFAKTQGIECRSGGANGDYQLIVSFARTVSLGSASVTFGTGSVQSTAGNNSTTLTINLTGVTNVQRMVVTLFDVNYGGNVGDLPIPMNILVGDTNNNGIVNSSDVTQTKVESGRALTNANFRADVSANGSITGSDVSLVKSTVGTALP